MLDDYTDWPEDLRQGRASPLLVRPAPLLGGRPTPWTPRDGENALFLYGGAEAGLDLASHHLAAALALAERHGARPSCCRP